MAVTLRWARATTEGVPSDPSLVGSKTKTSDEKRGNHKMQGSQKQIPPMKKTQPQNARGSKIKTSNKKRGNPNARG
jgi:hypothetical protein